MTQPIGRRKLLTVGTMVAAAHLTGCAWSDSKADARNDLPPVTKYGAVGDGKANDSAAFQKAASENASFRIPAGVYRLKSAIKLKSGQMAYFDPGAVIKAGALLDRAIFDAEGADGVQIVGNGAIIDLNEVTDQAISIRGSEGHLATRCRVSDILVTGRKATSDPRVATSALEFKYLDGLVAANIKVDGYAYKNAAGSEQGYSIGVFFCVSPKLSELNITNGNVGIEIYRCDDVQVSNFSIRDCIDNGIYILAGSNYVNFSQGRIDRCEEGVALRSDDVTLSNITITNCSNKGVSLRTGRRCKIAMCRFEGNKVHIGDNREGEPISNLSVSNTSLWNAREQVINLTATTDSDFDQIDVFESTARYEGGLFRLNNASRCSIRNSRFNNPGKTAPVFLRLSHKTVDAIIANNVFLEAATAISLVDVSGAHPVNTQILDNVFVSVTKKLEQSASVAGTVERPGP